MNSLKSGIAGFFGAVKSGAGYVKEQVVDDEKRAENVESLKGAVGQSSGEGSRCGGRSQRQR